MFNNNLNTGVNFTIGFLLKLFLQFVGKKKKLQKSHCSDAQYVSKTNIYLHLASVRPTSKELDSFFHLWLASL